VWWFDTNVSEDCATSIFRVADMEAAWFFKTLVSNHHTTLSNNPENHELPS
jgi:hypothetical protein